MTKYPKQEPEPLKKAHSAPGEEITLTIIGRPAGQGSKRHVGGGRMIEQSKYLPAWRRACIDQMRQQYDGEPLDGPLEVTATFYLKRPKKPKFSAPAVPPDADKLIRAIGDALTQARVVVDDARITTWHATKQYATGQTGATITIKETQ